MNRIVIIGNGFDKAHDLKTGYGDFLNHLTDSIAKFEGNKSIIKNGQRCRNYTRYIHRLAKDGKEDKWIGVISPKNQLNFTLAVNPHNRSIYFKSLIEENEILGGHWSDLESHYFQTLVKHKDSKEDIILINEEFKHLKELLQDYLTSEVEMRINPFHSTHDIFDMLKKSRHNDLEFQKNYFVTFNYTSKILSSYAERLKSEHSNSDSNTFPLRPIYIHGHLYHTDNPIIFGYGDENSLEYEDLALLQNNELLTNFKTFQYLRSNNYNQVLGILEESEENYVQIIGHSCSLCDKALLRTIFQHKNVKHIESTYHDDESKYFENVYNISRIFDDNTLMREKLIPLSKTFKI